MNVGHLIEVGVIGSSIISAIVLSVIPLVVVGELVVIRVIIAPVVVEHFARWSVSLIVPSSWASAPSIPLVVIVIVIAIVLKVIISIVTLPFLTLALVRLGLLTSAWKKTRSVSDCCRGAAACGGYQNQRC